MQVILREDVRHLGYVGEVVNVKAGYARNFLFPQFQIKIAESKGRR